MRYILVLQAWLATLGCLYSWVTISRHGGPHVSVIWHLTSKHQVCAQTQPLICLSVWYSHVTCHMTCHMTFIMPNCQTNSIVSHVVNVYENDIFILYFSFNSFDRAIDRDWLIDFFLIDCLIGWLINWLIDCLIDWLFYDWLIDYLLN